MKTVTIQLGNSDDKLSQIQWASFVSTMGSAVAMHAYAVHFMGAPAGFAQWQNAAWVCEVEDSRLDAFRNAVKAIRATYGQESVAFTIGETQFV